MDEKLIKTPIKIQLTLHGITYTVDNLEWDTPSDELIEKFTELLVCGGFHPSTIIPAGGGHYEVDYKEE